MTSEGGPVGTGPFDPDLSKSAVAAHPLQQYTIARWCRRELLVAELSTDVVQYTTMMGLAVRVDSTGDRAVRVGHAGQCRTFRLQRLGWHAAVGTGGQASDGRLLRRLL